MKLVIGSGEKAADTSVAAPYARSGQKKRGTSIRSRREITSATQQTIAIASSDCAIAIENCTVAATPKTATRPACSSQSGVAASDGAAAIAWASVIWMEFQEHH